jgi:REP element-mobilizing transposase RayT
MRESRLQAPDALHHVFTRGNNKQNIFLDSNDRIYFANLLASAIEKYSWICHSFCLMGNHYHLLVETPHEGLSEGMHMINGAYTVKFNKKHGYTGHVMQGRYHSPLVEHESHFLELLRYMALNPVKDGFVRHPGDWQWSSFRAFAGLEPVQSFLTTTRALGMFDDSIEKSKVLYTDFVLERLPEAIERSKGRPDLASLFASCKNKNQRNAGIIQAYSKYRYRMTEIATYLGISCTAVSRVVSGAQLEDQLLDFRI